MRRILLIAPLFFAMIILGCNKEEENIQPVFTGTLEIIFTQDEFPRDTMAVRAEITFDNDLYHPLARSGSLNISGEKSAKWLIPNLNYGNYYLTYERWYSNIYDWGGERTIPVQVRADATSQIIVEI